MFIYMLFIRTILDEKVTWTNDDDFQFKWRSSVVPQTSVIVSTYTSLIWSNTYEPWHVLSNKVVFWQALIQTSLWSLLLSFETSNEVRSVV